MFTNVSMPIPKNDASMNAHAFPVVTPGTSRIGPHFCPPWFAPT
jgi:hypothetical protein